MAVTLVDSYSESNRNTDLNLSDVSASGINGASQSFTAVAGTLDSCQFYLNKTGSPTGNATVELYAITGTHGTNAKPTGSPLATSDTFDVSTLTGTQSLVTFNFSGANRIALTNGTNYCLAIRYTSGSSGNTVDVGVDTTSPTHGGNGAFRQFITWSSYSGDVCFYLYEDITPTTSTSTTSTSSSTSTTTTSTSTTSTSSTTSLTTSTSRSTSTSTTTTIASSIIQFDSAVNGGLVNPGTSLTWSHTTSGSNRILYVAVFGDNVTDAITGVTYAGVAMTLINKVKINLDRWIYLFYLINPTLGANNVVVSANASVAIAGDSASYTGAKQTSNVDVNTTNTAASSSSITTSFTTLTDKSWTILVAKGQNGTVDPIPGANSYLRAKGNDMGLFDRSGEITPAGLVSMTVQRGTGTGNWASVMATIQPFDGFTTSTSTTTSTTSTSTSTTSTSSSSSTSITTSTTTTSTSTSTSTTSTSSSTSTSTTTTVPYFFSVDGGEY